MPRPRKPHPFHITATRWLDAAGKRVKPHTPGARKVTQKSQTYYADILTSQGPRRISLETEDLALAWEALRRKLKEEHERALGIRDEHSDHASTPLLEHLEAWMQVLRAKGKTGAEQMELIEGRLHILFEAAGWKVLPQLSQDRITVALARVKEDKDLSAQTRNHYLAHIKGFCRWAHKTGRLRLDPAADIDKLNVETDRRHDRRVASAEELEQLFGYLLSDQAALLEGMTGRHRALAYWVAMATGLRAGELRSLSRKSFDLDAGICTVRAGYSKRRRVDAPRLPAWLVSELRAWFDVGGTCWESWPAHHPGSVLVADLAAAGVDYTKPGPAGNLLYFDFHALRHYYCTQVGNQAGVDLKTLLTLTRHSDPKLALRTYAKQQEEGVRKAVEQLQRPGEKPAARPQPPASQEPPP